MSRFRLAVIAAFFQLATAAGAADLGEKKPVLAPLITQLNWSGFYIGVHAGALNSVNHWSATTVPFSPFNTDGTQALGGLQLGYRHQINRVILGVEADVSLAGVQARNRCDNTPATTCRADTLGSASLRGRLGYAFDSLHLYATAGLAVAQLKFHQTEVFVQNWGTHSRLGWTLGAGAEYALSRNWIAGVEYRYSDFGRKTHTSDAAIPIKFRPTSHQLTLRASYRF